MGGVSSGSDPLRELRVAQVAELDLVIENAQVSAYRANVNVSFKFERPESAPVR